MKDIALNYTVIKDQQPEAPIDISASQPHDKYRILFNAIPEGFCIIKVLFDATGKAFDFIVLEVNSAFEKQTGLYNAVGKSMRQLSPQHEDSWYEIYGKVALTGEAIKFEKATESPDCFYEVFASPVDKPEKHHVAVIFKDITARRQMEAELRKNEERQKFLLHLSDAIRPENNAIVIQEITCRLLGMYLGVGRVAYGELAPDSDSLLVSMDWSRPGISSITGSYQTDDFGVFVAEALQAGQPVIVEDAAADARISKIMYSNWESINVRATIACPLVKHNGLVAVFFIHNDTRREWKDNEVSLLTDVLDRTWEALERVRAEKALKESEEKYRDLFESMDEGYCIIQMLYDNDGKVNDWRFLEVNRAFEVNNGLSKAQGKTIKELTPDIEEKWMKIYDRVAQTGEPLRFREDSTALKRHFNLYAFRIDDPAERKVAVIFTDITRQSCAEAALRQSEQQFRLLTQSLPQLIWTAGSDGYCDFFNQQWFDYTGASYEEAKGDGWLNYLQPDQKEVVYKSWKQYIVTGEEIVYEFQLKGKDGKYNWFYVTGNPVRDKEGNITKWVGALTNIEGQKKAETRLQQLVDDRTKELQQSNFDLQQFAHVASHDLSEPVRKIQMLLDRLKDSDAAALSDIGRFYLDRINSATIRMSNMIDGVLEYSVLSNLEEAATNIELNKIIKNIEEDLELVIEQKNVQLHYSTLPVLQGVDTLIYQLFYNLIKNAIKFSKQDTAPVITITWGLPKDGNKTFAEIIVADNGIGFGEHEAEKIFKSFTRLYSKDKYEGTGLGLALCRNIAERHGGTITAIGKKGEGAVFTILLPLSANHAQIASIQ